MAIIKLTGKGIVRSGIDIEGAFFSEARKALINAGYQPTVWVDYLSAPNGYFVTIKRDKLVLSHSKMRSATTKQIQKAINLLTDGGH